MLLRAQQLLVQLADALQGVLELVVVVQPLFRQRFLFGGKADLFGATAGIADGQDPDQMAGALGAHVAAAAVADATVQQGTAEDLRGRGEFGGELGAGFEDRVMLHSNK